MANSFAFVISKNTYPDAFQANLIGVDQGTRIVYSATDTLTSQSVLYADSRLTQPIYGDPTLWIGAQLLTDDAVKYPISINGSGAIEIGYNTTTTTAAPTTTTTTSGVSSYAFMAYGGASPIDACTRVNPMITVYANTLSLNIGVDLYMDAGLTTPYNRSLYGEYLSIYFQAQDQVCTMGGALGFIITDYTAC
jgi:hypothetical protein